MRERCAMVADKGGKTPFMILSFIISRISIHSPNHHQQVTEAEQTCEPWNIRLCKYLH